MIYTEQLRLLYNEIKKRIPEEIHSEFHLCSVNNFINNLDEIQDEILRNEVANQVNQYLLTIKDIDLLSFNSLDLFKKNIHPIGWIFVKELKFRAKYVPLNLIYGLSAIIIIYLLSGYLLPSFIITIIMLLDLYNVSNKEKKGKVYGYKY